MSHSLQMHKCVDKQIEHKILLIHLVRRRLFRGFMQTNKYLAVLPPESVGEDVRRIGFVAKLEIQFTCSSWPDEDERDLPARQRARGDLFKCNTRRRAPREILYIDRTGHEGELALTRLTRGGIDLAELH